MPVANHIHFVFPRHMWYLLLNSHCQIWHSAYNTWPQQLRER